VGDLAARISALWRNLFDTLVRDNKVLPPVLALLAILLFAWVVAGAFLGGPEDEEASSGRAELVQSTDPDAGVDAPEVEDRDADSYAAYRNKDPFRQLLAPASASESDTGEGTTGAAPDDGTTPPASVPPEDTTGAGVGDQGAGGGGDRSRKDSDGDGLTNRDEERLGQDPRNPDTDGDGIPDGQDDADGDGFPDGQQGIGGAGTGVNPGGGGGAGGAGSGGGGFGSDDLFDSGGTLPPR
jgi:hypothetical protein